MKKQNQGGTPNLGGRPELPEAERRKMYSFRITPENLQYLKSLPGSAGQLINRLLDDQRYLKN